MGSSLPRSAIPPVEDFPTENPNDVSHPPQPDHLPLQPPVAVPTPSDSDVFLLSLQNSDGRSLLGNLRSLLQILMDMTPGSTSGAPPPPPAGRSMRRLVRRLRRWEACFPEPAPQPGPLKPDPRSHHLLLLLRP